eukprot:1176321-Prorocentrum_minimum.AAC.2
MARRHRRVSRSNSAAAAVVPGWTSHLDPGESNWRGPRGKKSSGSQETYMSLLCSQRRRAPCERRRRSSTCKPWPLRRTQGSSWPSAWPGVGR